MDMTARLNLPYLLPNQAQKHVTVNEALNRLDALVQLSVLSAAPSAPPATPQEGDAYLLPAGALSGGWANASAGQIAVYQDASWVFITPGEGWVGFDRESGQAMRFRAGAWQVQPDLDALDQLGVNAQPDAVNRLSVKSDAELLSHDDITPGSGDARKVINKKQASAVASTLYQDNWIGHAEIGLRGDNDLSIAVSSDGATFQTAARFDVASGRVTFPAGQAHPASGELMRGLVPTPGGDGEVSIFRSNVARLPNPRTLTIASVAGDVVTLTTPDAAQVYEDSYMQGVSMLRIWNLSRSPIAPAWVKASGSSTTVQVSDSAQLAGWQAGDTLQVGDPATETPGRVIALDISPMMQARLGSVFHQSGVLAKLVALPGGGVETGIELTSDGSSGTFLGVRGYAGQASAPGQILIPSTEASPVSTSNLVFVRENAFGSSLGVSIVSVNALLV